MRPGPGPRWPDLLHPAGRRAPRAGALRGPCVPWPPTAPPSPYFRTVSLPRVSVLALAPLVVAALIAPLPPVAAAAGPDPVPSDARSRPSDSPGPDPVAVPRLREHLRPRLGAVLHPLREADGYDPYVGNGYLGHRVPATGAGYASTGEKTGWPLYTPRYDGAFVSGLYAADQGVAEGREAVAALPSWTGVDVGVGEETLGDATRRAGSRTTARRSSSPAASCAPRCGGRRRTAARPTSPTRSWPIAPTSTPVPYGCG